MTYKVLAYYSLLILSISSSMAMEGDHDLAAKKLQTTASQSDPKDLPKSPAALYQRAIDYRDGSNGMEINLFKAYKLFSKSLNMKNSGETEHALDELGISVKQKATDKDKYDIEYDPAQELSPREASYVYGRIKEYLRGDKKAIQYYEMSARDGHDKATRIIDKLERNIFEGEVDLLQDYYNASIEGNLFTRTLSGGKRTYANNIGPEKKRRKLI